MAKGRIVIDTQRCKGCELCTTACPKDIIHMSETFNAKGYHPAMFVDPNGLCTGCSLCAWMCPDVVITVYRELTTSRRPVAAATT